MAELPKKLIQKLEQRSSEGTMRYLPEVSESVDFSSNDYLGFAQNRQIAEAALELLHQHGHINGSTGSRLLTGNHDLYKKLEQTLSDFHNSPASLVFNSGYDANLGFFSSVPQRGDLVFYDELVHASIRDGIQMSNAKSYKFAHNDLDDLGASIERNRNIDNDSEVFVVTESVFSMDGDSANLKSLASFCSEHGFHLVVDEAHAVGIFGEGKGIVNQLGLEKAIFARTITFGKALGCHGAAILCSKPLMEYLVNFARSLIYTTALPPHSVASIMASYEHLKNFGGVQRQKLFVNIQDFKQAVQDFQLMDIFIPSESAIQCAIIPGNDRVKEISHQLKDAGYNVKPILSPTVSKGSERLRFCLHSYNTKEEISRALYLLKSFIA
ncbi:aminotransferase class I/II-fold pyridoxal phosphate-dependent enzyme [Flagellimonas meishanensis]|uniref:aminotransferase class I/II-fold pyridoxal phosphate-dependent enzyme n=1 Tax=Flagellimonas meishanensis TaxID=2873264 RepID=UPI001CA6EE95|nr:pyridoxal phosphate-dependent aminotransferase family protein [[Muricauda] meishanensis]